MEEGKSGSGIIDSANMFEPLHSASSSEREMAIEGDNKTNENDEIEGDRTTMKNYHIEGDRTTMKNYQIEGDRMTTENHGEIVSSHDDGLMDNVKSEDSGAVKSRVSDPALACDLCRKAFSTATILRRHMKRHENGKHHRCPHCGQAALNVKSLNKHVEDVHRQRGVENGPPFNCAFCPKSFRRMWTRTQHEKLHTGVDLWICEVCEKRFERKESLTQHKLTHLDPSEREKYSHLCDKCGRRLSSKSSLIEHKKFRHAPAGVKYQYQCEICGNSYSKKSYLTEHVRAHQSGTVYLCNSCDKSFNTKTHLKAHYKRVHVEPDVFHACPVCSATFKCKRSAARHIKSHSGLKEHACPYCDRSFLQKCNLTSHVRTHTGQKPFECDICGKRFTQSTQMKTHRKTHETSEGDLTVVEHSSLLFKTADRTLPVGNELEVCVD